VSIKVCSKALGAFAGALDCPVRPRATAQQSSKDRLTKPNLIPPPIQCANLEKCTCEFRLSPQFLAKS
jgi:hypothetical protein